MAETQKFMGKNSLVKRLSAQVGSRSLAENILKKRKDMTASGELTSKGEKRNKMTAAGRAKDRAARASGSTPDQFSYNPKTNIAKKKTP